MSEAGNENDNGWMTPDWAACGAVPVGVGALQTTRRSLNGVSVAPYDAFNMALHVADDPVAVQANRRQLRRYLPAEPLWLEQVHGIGVVDVDDKVFVPAATPPRADASFSRHPGRVCAVMTADCLPLLLAARDGSVVAAAHVGWRGLAAGVIEATVAAMTAITKASATTKVLPAEELVVWLGPAIGARAFEVGTEVRTAFCRQDELAEQAFVALPSRDGQEKWHCDLALLARQRLMALGVRFIGGGQWCTFSDPQHFYSHRRDGTSGRIATLIWKEKS